MCWRNTEERYGAPAQLFHWGMALLIVGLLALGLYMEDLPNSPDKIALYGWHKSFGATVLALAILRLGWALANRSPTLPGMMSAMEKRLAKAAHYALYALMFLMPFSGWLMSSAAGYPVSVFGWFTLPDLIEPSKPMRKLFGEAHELLASGLMALLALHVLAALLHHFYHRDNVLRRMLPEWMAKK